MVMVNEKLLDELNRFFINIDDNIINNLIYFMYIGEVLLREIRKLNIDIKILDRYSKNMDICNIQDIFEFVSRYNNKFNVDLDLNKLIDDGVIAFNSLKYEKLVNNRRDEYLDLNGRCFNDGNSIIVENYGSLSDAVTLIHELSHYKDIPNKYNGTRFWFTEALAITEELIAIDELNDFNLKVYNFYDRLLYIKKCLKNITGVLPIMIVYQNFSDIEKDSYSKIFNKDLYELDMIKFLNYVNYYLEKNKKFNLKLDVFKQLITELKYVIGFVVAINLYKKYKLDNNYMEEIQHLHKLINEISIYDFLKKLNFDTQASSVIVALKEYISLFVGCENKKRVM